MSAMLSMAHWTTDRERSIGKNSPTESDQDPGLFSPPPPLPASPGSVVGDALKKKILLASSRDWNPAQKHPWKLHSLPGWILGDRIDLYCISTCEEEVEKNIIWVNCRFGLGLWTQPSHCLSSAARIYPTCTNMHPLTGLCRRCLRGWRKKRNRYAFFY